MLKLFFILNQLQGLNLYFTQSYRVFGTRSLMRLEIIVLIIFSCLTYHGVVWLSDNLWLRNDKLWLEESILIAAIICINSRRDWHYPSRTYYAVIFPSGLQCWLFSIWLLSSWLNSTASWCFWFFNFRFFFFTKWILDRLFFTLFRALVWTFDTFGDTFVWAFYWTIFVTLSTLLHSFLTFSQIWFFLYLISSLDQVIKWTTWSSWLWSVLSYTFSDLSSLARKGSNFNLSHLFSSLDEWFGSFILGSVSFATEGLALWILVSSRWCFQTRRCFLHNRQIISWFWHFSYRRFLWSWTIWILKLAWIHLDISLKLIWWNRHHSIFIWHILLSTNCLFRVLEQVTMVASGTLWAILSDLALIGDVVDCSSAWK